MKIQLHFAAFIVHFGFISVHTYDENGYQLQNFPALSAKYNSKDKKSFIETLQTGVVKNQHEKRRKYNEKLLPKNKDSKQLLISLQTFSAMKYELQRARNTNFQKRSSFIKRKRETAEEYYQRAVSVSSKNKRPTPFQWWEAATTPIADIEDEDRWTQVDAETLCKHALRLTKEVLDLEGRFLIGIIQQFYRIKFKMNNEIKWDKKFKQILMDCQSILDYDTDDTQMRIAGRWDPPDLTTIPLKPDTVSDLIKSFNQVMKIIEGDKSLKGVDNEIRTIRRLCDNAEAELHRFNHKIRLFMKRIEERLSSTTTDPSGTRSTMYDFLHD